LPQERKIPDSNDRDHSISLPIIGISLLFTTLGIQALAMPHLRKLQVTVGATTAISAATASDRWKVKRQPVGLAGQEEKEHCGRDRPESKKAAGEIPGGLVVFG
jgi:hypothetical protein